MTVKPPQKPLQERLNEASRDIQQIRTSGSGSDTMVYESDGNRISVMIKPGNGRRGSLSGIPWPVLPFRHSPLEMAPAFPPTMYAGGAGGK